MYMSEEKSFNECVRGFLTDSERREECVGFTTMSFFLNLFFIFYDCTPKFYKKNFSDHYK